MSKFQEQYKKKVSGFKNAATSRLARVKQREESRKKHRAQAFSENRNLLNASVNNHDEGKQSDPVEDRLTKLYKWKAERDRYKKLQQAKKKPPFIVGVPHHKLYSPVNNTACVAPKIMCKSPVRRITRATEKRLMNKALVKKVTAEDTAKEPNVVDKAQKNEKELEHSFAPKNYEFKGPSGLPKELLFGRVMLSMSANRSSGQISNKRDSSQVVGRRSTIRNTKKNDIEATPLKSSHNEKRILNLFNNISEKHDNSIIEISSPEKNNVSALRKSTFPSEPASLSPYIVSSRGKSNARKEQQMKRSLSLSQSSKDEIPIKETVMKNLNISIEEEERTAQYFQFLLNKEVARLNELCEKWVKIQKEPETTEDGQYEINQAIGQTNLLINKKFERFRRLVADCETGKGEMLVTCKDLQGFWDMMYMEVKNCDLRFAKLEKLRLQDWKEELPTDKPATRKKVIIKKKTVSAKPSAFKTFLAEKKKIKTHGIQDNNSAENAEKIDLKVDQTSNSKYKKTRSSNIRRTIGSVENKVTPMKHNKRLSLLHKVQLSETSKGIKSPLTMIKISRMCKTPEVQVDNTISYVNSNQTPGKSILKQKKDSKKEKESCIKTRNTVNFEDRVVLNEVPIDEEAQTKIDLAIVLSRIDSLEFDYPDEEKIHAERKLTFNDNSDEEESNIKESSETKTTIDKAFNKMPSVQIVVTPLQKLDENRNTPRQRRSLRKQNTIDATDETRPNEVPSINENMSTSLKEILDDADLSILNHKLEKHVVINDEGETTDHDTNVRILRNRIVTSIGTPKSKRLSKNVSMNIEESDRKENETPSGRRRRKSSLKVRTDNREEVSCINDTCSKENTNKRRSTRNVKFLEKECSGCLINKPALPVTPHVRRSKIH